jgi:Fe-S cluster assembly iron-binding protein IscA
MLTLTPVAAEAIKGVVNASGLSEEGGLRIASTEGPGYDVAVSPLPAEDDTVVDDQGAHVFLESQAAAELDDKVLDAQLQENRVSFALLEAAE